MMRLTPQRSSISPSTPILSALSHCSLDASLVVESPCIAQRILIASQKNSNSSSNLSQDHEIVRILLEPQPREITEIPSPFRQTNTTPSLCSRCVRVSTTKHQESKQENLPIKSNEMKQRTEMEQQQKSHTNKRRRETIEAAAAQTAALPFAEEAPEIAPGHGALLHKLRPRSSFSHQPTNRSLSQPTNQESILALSLPIPTVSLFPHTTTATTR